MGRPRKHKPAELPAAIDLPPEVEAEIADLEDATPLKQQRMTPEAFFQLVHAYPDHSATAIYWNRLYPVIARERAGFKHKYIERIHHPYPENEQYVLRSHGGGKYEVYFTNSNVKDSRVAKCFVEFSWQEHPPILNYAELVRCPENEPYLQSLVAAGEISLAQDGTISVLAKRNDARGMPAASPNNGGEAAMVSMVTTTHQKLTDYILQQAKGPQPMNLLEMASVLEKLASANRPSGDSTVLTAIMNQNTMLLKSLLEKSAAPAGPTSIESALALVSQLSEFGLGLPGGRAAPAAKMDWQGIAFGLGQSLAPTIAAVFRQPPTPSAQQPPQPQLPAPDGQQQQSAPVQDPFHAVAVRVVDCINRNLPGDNLAVAIDTFHGHTTYLRIRALGKEGIIASLQMFPDVWPTLEALTPQLERFIDEFLGAFDEEEEQSDAASLAATA
jgi:hypothetical protein